ncbi:Alpha-1,3/1,6-mannosyltransferase ALG2 [Dichanthelium oligosanthes]|uniref:Alpha-1,3/1,6-mannosyltransferase ALG2 n=1 Tax=Dichanthelium oligosanthes TaxID=888268 RepID=A0A1E5WJ67_9POAL|nr:Alpha-1,3/1,6-mannosyltransferase ALG2 [Dichanthelium oligosanthes]
MRAARWPRWLKLIVTLGGAERLTADAACQLAAHGHYVHVFTSHHDKNRCFEETVSDQVSVVIPLLKLKSSKIVFYCHFPDMLLAQHTTTLRRLYRKPIDIIEEATTGMADLILVNSKFTAATFARTFLGLHARGIEPGGYDMRLKENVEYLEELKRLAVTELVSEQVKFVTSCATSERNELLSNCLCVLYTPKEEHFGIVPLEAMAAHKPVIACNSGCPVETVVHEVTGFQCDPSPTEFSKAMLKLVSDHDLAVRMGKQAREHVVQEFSTKTFGGLLNSYVLNV